MRPAPARTRPVVDVSPRLSRLSHARRWRAAAPGRVPPTSRGSPASPRGVRRSPPVATPSISTSTTLVDSRPQGATTELGMAMNLGSDGSFRSTTDSTLSHLPATRSRFVIARPLSVRSPVAGPPVRDPPATQIHYLRSTRPRKREGSAETRGGTPKKNPPRQSRPRRHRGPAPHRTRRHLPAPHRVPPVERLFQHSIERC